MKLRLTEPLVNAKWGALNTKRAQHSCQRDPVGQEGVVTKSTDSGCGSQPCRLQKGEPFSPILYSHPPQTHLLSEASLFHLFLLSNLTSDLRLSSLMLAVPHLCLPGPISL